jgi:periplasmic protein TonB
MIQEEELPPSSSGAIGVPGGVGIPGGSSNWVIGSILNAAPATVPPPSLPQIKEPPKPAAIPRITVGGIVQAAKLVRQPQPVYPPLARQARVSGAVTFSAIIGVDGRIQNLTLVSGHPLLVPAAQEAIKQWLYAPTQLNGEAVEVITQIVFNFRLN